MTRGGRQPLSVGRNRAGGQAVWHDSYIEFPIWRAGVSTHPKPDRQSPAVTLTETRRQGAPFSGCRLYDIGLGALRFTPRDPALPRLVRRVAPLASTRPGERRISFNGRVIRARINSTERGCGRHCAARTADRAWQGSGALVFSHAAVKLSGRQAGLISAAVEFLSVVRPPSTRRRTEPSRSKVSFGLVLVMVPTMKEPLSMKREIPAPNLERHMPAVLEARSMLCAVPLDVSRGETKGVWLQRAARMLAISAAKAKRIYYGEVKRIDADTFERMRAAFHSLKAQADDNQKRLNELVYLRNELRAGGSRAVAGSGNQGAADRNRAAGAGGSGLPQDRPSAAFIRRA